MEDHEQTEPPSPADRSSAVEQRLRRDLAAARAELEKSRRELEQSRRELRGQKAPRARGAPPADAELEASEWGQVPSWCRDLVGNRLLRQALEQVEQRAEQASGTHKNEQVGAASVQSPTHAMYFSPAPRCAQSRLDLLATSTFSGLRARLCPLVDLHDSLAARVQAARGAHGRAVERLAATRAGATSRDLPRPPATSCDLQGPLVICRDLAGALGRRRRRHQHPAVGRSWGHKPSTSRLTLDLPLTPSTHRGSVFRGNKAREREVSALGSHADPAFARLLVFGSLNMGAPHRGSSRVLCSRQLPKCSLVPVLTRAPPSGLMSRRRPQGGDPYKMAARG